ncbi:hypothetical protein GCM10009555_091900 [Acrocarpospora macrocephala]|uniref:Fibronectin type-III domain-containing protein n=1 Tax=Acrocarpospora macrocephala TaxID=150177 RepID=A0A5M3X700_9ACTN|nr:putative Ig domain-containing protein [Acrocarpospora macrocephala]GES14653.1 hypothetical protein Amac_082500 [Acrocarpospora macrocephala]
MPRYRLRRLAAQALTVSLLATLADLPPRFAYAAGTTLFNQPFKTNTVNAADPVSLPALPAGQSGTNTACLTATGNNGSGLHSCTTNTDANGLGTLRLTGNSTTQEGGLFGAISVPTSEGLDVTFNAYQYGGTSADGLTFVVAAVDPANPLSPANIGRSGGSLGYSSYAGGPGLANAYLGFGFDVYGNFSNSVYQGSGCTNPAYINTTGGRVPGQVVVRGPGAGTVGYCAINSTATTTSSPAVALHGTTRATSQVPVEIVINPTASSIVTASGLTVASGTYKVVFTPVGGSAKTLDGALPVVPSSLYPSSNWTTPAGIPRQLAFGWVASTGALTDFHEIDNAKVVSFNPVPELTVAQTSYNGSSPQPGDPVTYTVVAGVDASGANETSPISVTETLPTGVVPVGAFGSGWTCQAPSGQKITCTNSSTPFAAGTTLPSITVVGIVTGSSVTPSLIQSSSIAVASSNDANPAIAQTTTAGTIPATPSGITVTPATSTIAGGIAVTVGGSNITGATAIEIGTVAEQHAGTPVTLLPCASGPAAGCFTVNPNGTLNISSMPARASADTVTVTVVTRGVAGAANYVYTDKPATPAAPTATAGVTSATVNWVAPSSHGSPITGYIVTPYLGGVAQTPQSFDASTTTRTLTGLTAGGSYTFTVAAVNAIGTSTASAQSNAVVPYTVPGRPTITAAVAGDSSATLTWTAPANGSSPITSYVVTPYIGAVAQPTRTFSGTATTETVTGLTPGTAYTFTVTAVNLAGPGPASLPSGAVTPNANPTLTFPPPPGGQVGVSYSDQLTFSGGTAPFVWSVSSGTLPPGLTLNSATGLLSGTPTTAGSYPFTVKITDSGNQTDTRAVTLVVVASPTLNFPAPPGGQVGVPYNDQLTVSGGTAPFAWSVSSGTLPPGLTLNSATGLLSGTPTTAGSYPFTVRVTDANNQSDTKAVTLVVGVGPLIITKTADKTAAAAGATVNYTITVNNTGPSTFTGVTFTDPLTGVLDDATYNANVAATQGSAAYNNPNVTWTGTLAPGAVATITYSVTVKSGGDGTLANTVTSPTLGANCTSGSTDSRCRASVGLLELTIVKTSNPATASPGDTVGYTITVTNTGGAAYPAASFSDPLSGVLDDATYNADAAATSGTASYSAPVLSWNGNLSAGASAIITYSVTVRSPDPGDKSLTNTVTSAGSNCPTDPRCTRTVPVRVPQLTLTSAVDSSTTVPTGVVRYTVTATNSGEVAYSGAGFTFSLAGALGKATYNNDAVASSGGLTFDAGSLTWSGALAVGATVTVTASVTVNDPASGSLTSLITSTTAGNNCPAGSGDPACVTTVEILVPQLTIEKTADAATAEPGDVVAYTVTVTNSGQTPYTGAAFTDSLTGVLTDAVYNNDAAATSGTVDYSAPTLTWTGDLGIGAVATITYTVTIRDPYPGDAFISNTVTSTTPGNTCPAGSSDSRCTASVTVQVPALTLTKRAGTSTVTEGGTVEYTVTVANTGQVPYTGASFTDALAGVLDDATYNNDAAATSGTVDYNAPTLTWTGNLAVGASATITYTVTVRAPDPGNGLLTNTLTSTARGNNCQAGSTDTRCRTTVRLSRLILTQSFAEPTATPDSVVRLNATFTNTGQTPYTGISVFAASSDVLDDAAPLGDQVASTGTLTLGPTGITWVGNLPVGGVVTVTGGLIVKDPDPGNKILTGTLVSAAPGNNCPSGGADPRCTARLDVLQPELTISKAADTATQVPGGTINYTVTVENTGETPYIGAVTRDDLSGLLDDATYDGNASATVGSLDFTSPILTWTGDLPVGGTAVITYSATVSNPDPGNKLVFNTVSSDAVGSTCPPGQGNPACSASVTVLTPALTIVKTADQETVVDGETITYTLKVTNSGQTAYTAANLSDDLSGILDDAVYNGDAAADVGTVGYTAPTLTWSGNLAVGAVATITYTVTVDNPDLGDESLVNTAVSTTPGSNCPSGSSDSRCTVTVAVATATDLTFRKTSDVTSAVPGGVVSYTITVTNSAATPYLGATFTDPLTSVLDDAGYNNDAAAGAGTVGYTAPDLTWTGNVPASGSVTITYSVTVKTGGNGILTNALTSTSPQSNCPAAGDDPRCTETVTVSDLTIDNNANVTTTTPGGVIEFTSTFTNTGQTPYTGISVSYNGDDLFDDVLPNGDETVTSGTLSISPTGLVWTGNIAVGATVTLSSSFTVKNPDDGNRDVVLASISDTPGSNCPTGNSDPRCSASVQVLIPALTITKAAGAPTTVPGGTVAYTVTLQNTGETPYTGISVTDQLAGVLDDAVYNADATATAGNVSFASQVLTWTGDIAVGATVTINYSVTVRNPDPGDKIMINVISSTAVGNNCPDSACTVTVAVLTPALTIVKNANTATTAPGGTVGYTITVTNTGQTSYPAATLTDSLAGVLDDAVYTGDAAATTGAVSPSGSDLSWTGALAPGGSSTITYSVTVRSPDPGDKRLINTVSSTSAGSNCPSGGSDHRCTRTVPVSTLSLTSTADTTTAIPTGVVRYTVTATNSGEVPYSGASFAFSLAEALAKATYNNDAVASSGGLTFDEDGLVTWSGALGAGETMTATASVTVDDPASGSLTSSVTSTTAGNNCPEGSDDPACVTTVEILVPQLTIVKTADVATAEPGDVVAYTVTVTNSGETPYTGAAFTDSLTGVLEDAVYNNDAATNVGAVDYTSPNLTWTGDLDIGAAATITYTVTIRDPYPGDAFISNTVTSTTPGNTCPAACTATVTVLVPALTIIKTADVGTIVAGGTVEYTVTVANTGQAPYTGASFTDPLGGVLDDATYNNDAAATSGAVDYNAPTLTWTGDLAVGATATITYSVTTTSPSGGNAVLVNTVSSDTRGSTCPDEGTDPRCVSTVPVIALSVALADLTSGFTLMGVPDATVRGDDAVTMTVITNSPGGYNVAVSAASPELTAPGIAATIPISALRVRKSGTNPFSPLSSTEPVSVHDQSTPSAPHGDPLSTDYEIDIPFVSSGNYSASLDYITSTQ